MKKFIFCLFITVILLNTACSKKEPPVTDLNSRETSTVLKLGFSTDLNTPRAIASEAFKQEVEQQTFNRIKIQIIPNLNDSDLIANIVDNQMDIAVSSAANYSIYSEKAGISAIPFLFDTFEEAWNFIDNPLSSQIYSDLEKSNMIVLATFNNGFRCVTTRDKPIEKAEDMENLNIRTPPNPVIMETMTALKANPKPYAFTELKKALKQNIFDSQENPIPVIYNAKLYEEQKYLAITNHSYDAMPLVIRRDLWNRLSENDRQIVKTAALNAQALNRKIVYEQTQTFVKNLQDKGMTVTYPDLKDFKNKCSSVIDSFSRIYGSDLMSKVKEITDY